MAPIKHIWIPDTQVRQGVPTEHIEALGNYIAAKRHDKVIVAGDFWDMPATSDHNTAREQEGLRVIDDIAAGKKAMRLLWKATEKQNKKFTKWKKKRYEPEKHFLYGNHEMHLERIWERNPAFQDLVSYDDLELEHWGFKIHEFLKPVDIDGILYCHYFANPNTGHAYGGMIETRLKNIGQSFTQGHCQSFAYGEREVPSGKRYHGLVAGAFYMHNESYKRFNNHHWRGVVVKHEVHDGQYDIMKVGLDYLLREYL